MILKDIHYDQLRSAYRSIKDTRRRLQEMLSAADKEVSKYYHELEKKDIDELHYETFLTGLQKELRKRRVIKEELRGIQVIYLTTKETIENLNESLQRANKRSEKIKEQLNTDMTIYEVL